MEWEAQSTEEMGKKYYPLMGPGGGDELSLVGEPVRDVAGQISGIAQLLDLPLRDGGGHPPASRVGFGHIGGSGVLELRFRVLELEVQEGARKVEKRHRPRPLYKGDEYQESST